MISDQVYIGLGSNLGDCPANLETARRMLAREFQTVLTASTVFRSEPVGVLDQPWFFNQVVSFPATGLHPIAILKVLKEIERQMGRVPTIRYGPRLIDLDLLFFNNWVFESADLVIPHPRLCERAFVLMPLLELNPALYHPKMQQTIVQLYQEVQPVLSCCEKFNMTGMV